MAHSDLLEQSHPRHGSRLPSLLAGAEHRRLGAYNEDRLRQLQDPVTWGSYVMNADFWARTLQNWQSEFLAVGTMVVFSIYLRQRGSPESKPVGEPHASIGVEG
jgi:hypothetical protein